VSEVGDRKKETRIGIKWAERERQTSTKRESDRQREQASLREPRTVGLGQSDEAVVLFVGDEVGQAPEQAATCLTLKDGVHLIQQYVLQLGSTYTETPPGGSVGDHWLIQTGQIGLIDYQLLEPITLCCLQIGRNMIGVIK
jgi:hypothetical protein